MVGVPRDNRAVVKALQNSQPGKNFAGMLEGAALSIAQALMAPGDALRGEFNPIVSAEGVDPYSPLIGPAMNMAGNLTLGAGAIPGEGLGMGMRVFHGTTAPEYDVFKPNMRKGEQLGFGIHFAEDRGLAEKYAFDPTVARRGSNPRVIEADIDLTNPLKADRVVKEGSVEFEIAKKLAGRKLFTTKDENGVPSVWLQNAIDSAPPAKVEEIMRQYGFDGIEYEAKVGGLMPGGRGMNVSAKGKSYVVFDPSKISILSKK